MTLGKVRHRAAEALHQKQQELQEAQRLAHIGSWHWDASTDVTTGSDEPGAVTFGPWVGSAVAVGAAGLGAAGWAGAGAAGAGAALPPGRFKTWPL